MLQTIASAGAGNCSDVIDDVVDLSRLRATLLAAVYDTDRQRLEAALRDLVGDARRCSVPPERILLALKRLWHTTPRPGFMGVHDWDSVYRYARDTMLGLYFEDSTAR